MAGCGGVGGCDEYTLVLAPAGAFTQGTGWCLCARFGCGVRMLCAAGRCGVICTHACGHAPVMSSMSSSLVITTQPDTSGALKQKHAPRNFGIAP